MELRELFTLNSVNNVSFLGNDLIPYFEENSNLVFERGNDNHTFISQCGRVVVDYYSERTRELEFESAPIEFTVYPDKRTIGLCSEGSIIIRDLDDALLKTILSLNVGAVKEIITHIADAQRNIIATSILTRMYGEDSRTLVKSLSDRLNEDSAGHEVTLSVISAVTDHLQLVDGIHSGQE